ncbi:MAG: hypothetical protein WC815_01185 [Vicinamibacterales bacterium]|jgi:hypothetical protein
MSRLEREVQAIEYERWMLHETGLVLRTRWNQLRLVDANTYIESHAIHLRNLIEFLFDPSDKNHMCASDAAFGAVSWNEPWPDGFGKLFGRASAEIAHLSRGRVVDEKTNWLPEHAARVEERFQRWLSQTSDEVQRFFYEAQSRHVALFEIAPDGNEAETGAAGRSAAMFNTLTVGHRIGPDE